MKKLTPEQRKEAKKLVIVILAILCVAALVWFILSLRQSIRTGQLQTVGSFDRHYEQHVDHDDGSNAVATPPVPITIDSIRPWMTFNYLTVVFKLKPDFLKNALGITDTRYPNIRIDTYVRIHHLSLPIFMKGVTQAITSYSEPK